MVQIPILFKDDEISTANPPKLKKGVKNYYELVFNLPSGMRGKHKAVRIESLTKIEHVPLINNKCVIPAMFSNSSEISITLFIKGEQLIETNTLTLKAGG